MQRKRWKNWHEFILIEVIYVLVNCIQLLTNNFKQKHQCCKSIDSDMQYNCPITVVAYTIQHAIQELHWFFRIHSFSHSHNNNCTSHAHWLQHCIENALYISCNPEKLHCQFLERVFLDIYLLLVFSFTKTCFSFTIFFNKKKCAWCKKVRKVKDKE